MNEAPLRHSEELRATSTRLPRRLYAMIRSMEEFELPERRVRFQAVDAEWFDNTGERIRTPTLNNCESMRTFMLRISLTSLEQSDPQQSDQREQLKQSLAILRTIKTDSDARWFEFRIMAPRKGSGQAAALRIGEHFGQRDRNVRLMQVRDLTRTIKGRRLKQFYKPKPQWLKPLPNFIHHQLNRPKLNDEKVTAYDVGHGNAVGIHHRKGWVQCYVDLGGGVWPNQATYPTGLRFCFAKRPLIVLTHWHEDHWVSAKFCPDSLSCDWLVPRQNLGPADHKHLLAVEKNGGKVMFWMKPPGEVEKTGMIKIGRCLGKKVNDSGLAVVVRTKQGEILLPGDCGYSELPRFWKAGAEANVLSLMVPHHGGKTKTCPPTHASIPSPSPKGSNKLVYSIGRKDGVLVKCYGHPLKAVETAHKSKWPVAQTRKTNAKRTGVGSPKNLGHVLMSCGALGGLACSSTCSGACDLAPTQ